MQVPTLRTNHHPQFYYRSCPEAALSVELRGLNTSVNCKDDAVVKIMDY